MPDLKNPISCKVLAIVLSVFLIVEVHFLYSQGINPVESFNIAKQEYAEGNFASAKATLEEIVKSVDEEEPENKLFLGYVYLLLGACNEMLEDSEAVVQYYQKAKFLLEENEASIEGINFSGFIIYSQIFGAEIEQVEEDVLIVQFGSAKEAFLAENYLTAREELENLAASLETLERRESFKGETYLLLGATYEKLKLWRLAIKYYCMAKEILGKGKTIEGLDLNTLHYYGVKYKTAAGVAILVLIAQFESAQDAYFREDYSTAKTTLEKLTITLKTEVGWDFFKGEIFLLLGASCEKLEYKNLALNYYCKAKELLGEGKTIEGLDLETLRYYKEMCKPVVAAYGVKKEKRKGGGGGKFIKTIIGLALIGGIIWFLFFSKNSPLKKKDKDEEGATEKGKYTSITVKLEVTYKGINSKGTRKLTIDNTKKLEESFSYPQNADSTSDCEDAVKEESYSYTLTTTGDTLDIKQEYLNWDYHQWITPGTNYKILCADWRLTIQSYQYEQGKLDPGTPVPTGLDDLSMDVTNDCQAISNRVHNCETTATVTFNTPTSASQSNSVYSVTQTKVKSSKGD